MKNSKTVRLFSKLLTVIALAAMVFSTFVSGNVSAAQAKGAQPSISSQAADGSFYYYADGKRIELNPSLSWVAVRFANDDLGAQSAAVDNSSALLGSLDQARRITPSSLALLPLKAGVTAATIRDAVKALRADTAGFALVNPVFQTSDAEMAISDEFVVTFPAGMGMDEINAINAANGVELVDAVLGQDNTFVLRVTGGADLLEMANKYQESGIAIHSAPNFIRIVQKPAPAPSSLKPDFAPMAGTNDTYYPYQWHLNNIQQYGAGTTLDADIDAPEAWDLTTGSSSIIIAVLDEGVDLSHEDYSSKLVPGYDATGGGSSGGPWGNDAHGTNVAGLAASGSNNSLGVAGVCQACKIMPVRIAYSDANGNWVTTDATIANAITWAYQNGADILNNSWGGGSEATVINTAFSNAKTLGRGGKGSVIVISAGNSNDPTVSYPAYLNTAIAVAASNLCDQRKAPTNNLCNGYEYSWGSNYGSALDISSPGVWLYSTDITGAAGYGPGNYFDHMNGTSGAAPIVSGVAGLVLSVNPNLTSDEVQSILQSTADDVNGGGWDAEMGYGRVNAYNAVVAAGAGSTTFSDVPATYWAYDFIERLYNAGITSGCSTSPMMYCPTASVTRAQMAIFILRGIHGSAYVPPAATGTVFSDVSTSTFGAAWIEQFAAEGITTGCGNGKFCPDDLVTRAQMAIFLLKGEHGSAYVPPVATGIFPDVPVGSFAADWIEQLYNEGITSGCGGGNYCPNSFVLRDQMAVFLVRAFNLP